MPCDTVPGALSPVLDQKARLFSVSHHFLPPPPPFFNRSAFSGQIIYQNEKLQQLHCFQQVDSIA